MSWLSAGRAAKMSRTCNGTGTHVKPVRRSNWGARGPAGLGGLDSVEIRLAGTAGPSGHLGQLDEPVQGFGGGAGQSGGGGGLLRRGGDGTAAWRAHLPVYGLTPTHASLEEAFMQVTQDSIEYHAGATR
jgi:hypothetical protein